MKHLRSYGSIRLSLSEKTAEYRHHPCALRIHRVRRPGKAFTACSAATAALWAWLRPQTWSYFRSVFRRGFLLRVDPNANKLSGGLVDPYRGAVAMALRFVVRPLGELVLELRPLHHSWAGAVSARRVGAFGDLCQCGPGGSGHVVRGKKPPARTPGGG